MIKENRGSNNQKLFLGEHTSFLVLPSLLSIVCRQVASWRKVFSIFYTLAGLKVDIGVPSRSRMFWYGHLRVPNRVTKGLVSQLSFVLSGFINSIWIHFHSVLQVKILMCENEVPGKHDLLFNVLSGHRMFSL